MSYTDFLIDTGRITLTGITESYQEDIFREFNGEITRYMHPRPAEKMEETLAFIHKVKKDLMAGSQIVVCVLKSSDQEFLGCAGLHDIKTDRPELGIWIKKSAHGNGYGMEAMRALKEWADRNLTYQFIKYPVDIKNGPSRRIPESMGGVVGKVYSQKNLSGNTLNIFEYRIFQR